MKKETDNFPNRTDIELMIAGFIIILILVM